MSDDNNSIRRRQLLQTIAAGATVSAIGAGTVSAKNGNSASQHIVGTNGKKGANAAKQKATSVHRDLDLGDVGHIVSGTFPEEALEGLRRRPDVRYIEEDGQMQAIGEQVPWGVDRVDADAAQASGFTGAGADIAILDSGIDSDHPDLQANLGEGKAYVDCSSASCSEPWGDDNGHGTHCAGTAAAVDNSQTVVGVASEATLHAVKVLDSSGYGYFSDISAGIKYAADNGWDVVSMSLGSSTRSYSAADAVQYATQQGTLCVAAAGNSGCNDCVMYPAAEPEVVAVSATTSSDSIASFSSTGPEIDLAAPGQYILSTVPDGTAYYSGTSMACPHVAGAGGVVMASGYSNTEARARLEDTAEDIGLSTDQQGNGLLDVEAAVGNSGGDTNVAVSTGSASSVGETTATLEGTLSDLGGASSADVSFEWGERGGSLPNATSVQTLSASGAFDASVSGLTSGTEYEFRAVAEASDGDTDTGSILTFTTDSSSGSTAPVVDSYTVTEAGSPNPHAEITADWAVSDADADLSEVRVEVVDSSGRVVDAAQTSVSGGTASGTNQFKLKHGGNATYDVRVTVTDAGGNSASQTETVRS